MITVELQRGNSVRSFEPLKSIERRPAIRVLQYLSRSEFPQLTPELIDKVLGDRPLDRYPIPHVLNALRSLVYDCPISYSGGVSRIRNGLQRCLDGESGELPTKATRAVLEDWLEKAEQKPAMSFNRKVREIKRRGPSTIDALDFSSTPPLALAISWKDSTEIPFEHRSCGHGDARRADYIIAHTQGKRAFHCMKCLSKGMTLRDWLIAEDELIQDSRIKILNDSEDVLNLSMTSKDEFEVYFGICGHARRTSCSSLKSRAKAARKKGVDQLVCIKCNIPAGAYELDIRSWLSGRIYKTDVKLSFQHSIEGLRSMSYDMLLEPSDGTRYLIEVDGGHHYGEGPSSCSESFEQRIERDRLKTKAALEGGYRLIRIDARQYSGRVTNKVADVLLAAISGELPIYTALGKECPGAALVENRLKGF